MVVSAGEGIKLWNSATGTYVTLSGQSGYIHSADIAPDGKIVTASSDGSVALWSSLGNLLWKTTHHENKHKYDESKTPDREVKSVAFPRWYTSSLGVLMDLC